MYHITDIQMIKRNQVNKKTQLFHKLLLSITCVLTALIGSSQSNKNTQFKEEYAIFGINLQDDNSTEKVLGKNIWEMHFEADEMFPRIECFNKDKHQILRLFFFYGGVQNSVAEFEVLYTPKKYKRNKKSISTAADIFKSNNGVSLGMSKSKVISLIGNHYKIKKTANYEELIYYTEDTNKGILKKIGGVAYFIKCRFIKGKLCQYNFGFEYP
jgi:hypothetical protein